MRATPVVQAVAGGDNRQPVVVVGWRRRLAGVPARAAGLSEGLGAPWPLSPAGTTARVCAAGREVALTFTSLTATLFKGAAIALNVAGEVLRDYTERHSNVIDLQAARQTRRLCPPQTNALRATRSTHKHSLDRADRWCAINLPPRKTARLSSVRCPARGR